MVLLKVTVRAKVVIGRVGRISLAPAIGMHVFFKKISFVKRKYLEILDACDVVQEIKRKKNMVLSFAIHAS